MGICFQPKDKKVSYKEITFNQSKEFTDLSGKISKITPENFIYHQILG